MDRIILARPGPQDARAALAYIDAHRRAGEHALHGSGGMAKHPDFKDWLALTSALSRPETTPAGYVPATTFFGKREADGKIVGMIDVRHRLNEYLSDRGGHIGYGVHPKERQKGYASQMLRQALIYLASLHVPKALLTCDAHNLPSKRTILNAGGILEDARTEESGNVYLRFFIDLSKYT